MARRRAGHSRHVESQMSLVKISRVSCDRRARAARRLLNLLQRGLEADDAAEDLWTVADPGMHQPVQMALADAARGCDFRDADGSMYALNLVERSGHDTMNRGAVESLDQKTLEDVDMLRWRLQ